MRCRPVAFTAACTAAVCLTGLTAAAPPSAPLSPSVSPVPSVASPAHGPGTPGSGEVHSVPVPGTDPARRELPARATEPFSLVGVTWDDPNAELGGTVEVRTRDSRTGVWSSWHTLDIDLRTPEPGPGQVSAELRAGSRPLWTGPSDGVQLRAEGASLPRGLRVELVDPQGGDPAPSSARAEVPAGAPAMTTRAGWGADESKVGGPPTYNSTTKAVFVHHTAGSNTYQCADSPAIVRAVFTYHVEGQGWNDIGYHFLVDKCGRIFEGRAGGIDRPVQGAHTYGFNIDTSSVSVIGDYSTATTTPAVRDAVMRVASWKLGLYGLALNGTTTLTASVDNGKFRRGQRVTLPRLPGHRDAYPTECPGGHLYADLPAIRAAAAARGEGPGDPDASPVPWPLDPGSEAAAVVPDGAEEQDSVGGDFDGDGDRDLAVAYRTPEGATPLVVLSNPERGRRTASPTVLMGAGGTALASGDMNGDGYDDLAVSTGRGIVTYHGSPTGLSTAGAPSLAVGADAGALTAQDLDDDGYADLLAGPDVIASGGPLGLAVPGNEPAATAR
ncbi:FG-GAP-like repeat-containing protein [Streptomyces sp. WMMC940]|uniref:FG-GAP-like repeat-containing protein n=1 Tax=Streptomyces sp. WMMC940 TaxID=3015153 RepID=UPI0022B73ECC|nr:FG-GAP-like repeat-containing protein [Streptomyces sp. WMMC940]MCZ7458437.1 N-acetylmuramoyl-L-alanine amidase [Streptomyces sp. WMMC940]